MKRLLLLVILALVALSGPDLRMAARADTDAPAAVLTSCRGPVTVTRADGQTVAASFGLSLAEGDEVRTGTDAEAEIMFSSGNWVQVGPGSSMRIKTQRAPSGEKPREQSFAVVQNFLKLKSSEGTSSIGGLRSGGASAALSAVAPCQTKVRDAHPTFTWAIEDASTELHLTIYHENGVHWQHAVTGSSLAYPADAPALSPGVSYSWTLETTDPLVSPPLRTPAAFFEVIAPADVAALDAQLAGINAPKGEDAHAVTYHLMRASLFFDRGLVADAISETETALAADPQNASLHAILARLYAETGRARDAIDSMQKSQG